MPKSFSKIKWKPLFSSLGFVIPLIIFYFLFHSLIENWVEFKKYALKLNYPYLGLSFLILGLTQLYMVWIWTILLRKAHTNLNYKNAFTMWFISALGRYIPGKFWQLVGMAYLGEKMGIRAELSFVMGLVAQLMAIVSGVIISLPLLKNIITPQLTILFLGSSLLFLHPGFLRKVLQLIAAKFKRKYVSIDLKFSHILSLFCLYFASWIFYGTAFYFLLNSLFKFSLTSLFNIIATFATAYVLGLVAIFVPGGLGVREGILTLYLASFMPAYLASLIALVARVWISIVEVILTVIALFYYRKFRL